MLQAEPEVPPTLTVRRTENIAVVIRSRPPAVSGDSEDAWALDVAGGRIGVSGGAAGLPHMHKFAAEIGTDDTATRFDRVFDAQSSTRQVYKAAAQGIVLSALEGVNGAVLAYGQTGSGKTYTMLGDHASLGVVTMALMDVFSSMQGRRHGRLRATATLVELYNERLVDLFVDKRADGADAIAIKVCTTAAIVRGPHFAHAHHVQHKRHRASWSVARYKHTGGRCQSKPDRGW